MARARLAENLWTRAEAFLEEATEARNPDLAAFFAEQAIQLALKAFIIQLGGIPPRSHSARELMGRAALLLAEAGWGEEAQALQELARRERDLLIMAEEAYTLSRYGEEPMGWDEAEKIVGLAERIIAQLEEMVKHLGLQTSQGKA